jgi:RNA polymerase sigma-70 factor, ECF subfamily
LSPSTAFAILASMFSTIQTTERGIRNEILVGLLDQIVCRNERALAEFYDRTNGLVRGLVLRIVRQKATAEDITQEVYMQVWRRGETFDPTRGNVTSWIVTIARNRALDALRSSRLGPDFETNSEELDHFRSQDPDPEREHSDSEHSELIRAVLRGLPLDQRRAIELAFFHDLTHNEIAIRTGLPLGTIKSRIRSGMRGLREQLSFLDRHKPRNVASPFSKMATRRARANGLVRGARSGKKSLQFPPRLRNLSGDALQVIGPTSA